MKKIYTKPDLQMVRVKVEQNLLEGSFNQSTSEGVDEMGEGSFGSRSGFDIWGDEEE